MTQDAQSGWNWLIAATVFAVLAGATLILSDPNASHHDDDLTHFQIAQWSGSDFRYLLDSWGRPGFTAAYALPAQAGWVGAKFFSLVLATATVWLTALLARDLGMRQPWVAGLFVWAQPLFFRLSTSTLTELPAALYLAATLVLFFRGHHFWASLVFGLEFLTRHETAVFLPLWIAALWIYRRPGIGWLVAVAAALTPMAATNLLSVVFGLQMPASVFAQARTNLDYGFGTPLSYAGGSAVAFGAMTATLAVLGVFQIRQIQRLWLIAALAGSYLAVQTILRTFNLFATGGYPRFLVAICPLIAVLALAGWENFSRLPRAAWWTALGATVLMTGGLIWESCAGILDLGGIPMTHFWWLYGAILLQGTVVLAWLIGRTCGFGQPLFCAAIFTLVLQWGIQQWPVENPGTPFAAKRLVAWLKDRGLSERPILTMDPWVKHYLGIRTPYGENPGAALSQCAPGTILVWDANHGPSATHRLTEAKILQDGRFVEIERQKILREKRTFLYVVAEKR